jgi:hypothetical protein
LAIGYISAQIIPLQLGGDAGHYIQIADAILGKGGEFYY